MTNTEIINKAIHQAILNGWLNLKTDKVKLKDIRAMEIDIEGLIKIRYLDLTEEKPFKIHEETVGVQNKVWNSVIFSHEFAKALWGENPITCTNPYCIHHECSWQYHLQQMVLKEDPLKYLEQFLTPLPEGEVKE